MDHQVLDYLPQEVLTDIFAKLPIKSLLLSTVVCKSWHTFITQPTFVTAHINRPRTRSHNNAHDLILLCNYNEHRKEETYSLRIDDPSFYEYKKIEFPFKSAVNSLYRIVGCCNGVVCSTDDQFCYVHDTILWNPSIRKSVTLPKPRVSKGNFEHVMGFGFDPKMNDYKVVRNVYRESRRRSDRDSRLSVDVFPDSKFQPINVNLGSSPRHTIHNPNHLVVIRFGIKPKPHYMLEFPLTHLGFGRVTDFLIEGFHIIVSCT